MNKLATVFIVLMCTTGVQAGPVFSGFLNDPANTALRASDLTAPLFGSDSEIANNVALFDLTITIAGPTRFLSTGFAAGGADPYFTLLAGSGIGTTFLGSNFAQAFSTGGDFDVTLPLGIGTYTVAIGVFANLSFAENSGAGTLGDGFTGLGVPEFLGSTYYEVQVTEGSPDVPEPSYFLIVLLIAGVSGIAADRRRRIHSQAFE
jgi:hypothetical protein